MPRPFKSVRPASPGRSVFDLSYSKLFTCDMGELIPVCCDEMVPGDKFKIGAEAVVRFQPLVAPILHEINIFCHYFFVPYRLLFNEELGDSGNWEDFITGGIDGQNADVLPRWPIDDWQYMTQTGKLWDHFGFPMISLAGYPNNPCMSMPLDFPRRAYNMIWNEYYRDETLQPALDIVDPYVNVVQLRNWTKDYFTSALLWQQRGTAPALPIGGTTSADWSADVGLKFGAETAVMTLARTSPSYSVTVNTGGNSNDVQDLKVDDADLNNNTVDLSSATTFDVADLRLAFQIQKWMERNARAGARYKEFLYAHFQVTVQDSRVMRPEYIGGFKAPVIVSEVLQTSNTISSGTDASPQGNMAGHGISAVSQFCGEYFAPEFGLIMGIMSVMPKPMYHQGMNRQWLRRTKYDFYFPEFANLSEQMIEQGEIFMSTTETDNYIPFGYQGRYDEMRYKPNMVTGLMRPGVSGSLAHWNLCRHFSGAPTLESDFIECNPAALKRIFAVQSEPGLLVSYANLIKAIRPLPISAEPGLIDHG